MFVILNGELGWSFACKFSFACASGHRALTEGGAAGREEKLSSVWACGPHPAQSPLQFPPSLASPGPASASCCEASESQRLPTCSLDLSGYSALKGNGSRFSSEPPPAPTVLNYKEAT